MAEQSIDQLSIKIEADAEKATQAIHNLTSSLDSLKSALGNINTNSFSGFANSIESLSTSGRRMDLTTKSIAAMAREISSHFGIRSKEGVDELTASLSKLASVTRQWEKNDYDNGMADKMDAAKQEAEEVIKSYARIKKQVDETAQSVRNYVSATNKGTTKVSLTEVAGEFGENFSNMRKVLGKNFTSELKSTEKGVQDLAEYLNEMNSTIGTSFDTENIDRGFEQLVETLERARAGTESFNEAVKNGNVDSREAIQAVGFYSEALLGLSRLSDDTKSSGIDAIVDSFERLSAIQLPDFTPFALAIKALDNASLDKVVAGVMAVKTALDESTPSAENLKEAFTEVVSKVSETAKELAQGVNEELDTIDDKAKKTADKAAKEAEKAAKEAEKAAKKAEKEISDAFAKIGKAAIIVNGIAKGMDRLANVGVKAFKLTMKPLEMVGQFGKSLVTDFKEKLSKVTSLFQKFSKKASDSLNKLSRTWARVMRTFTFMLVRKAITAIIGNIKEATDALVIFEMQANSITEGRFNRSLSDIINNFEYIGRAIVAAFEPLVNFAAPILDWIADKVVNILTKVGEFLSALTGQTYYVKAKKSETDYGKELTKDNKKIKEREKLLLGIDELNTLNKKNETTDTNADKIAKAKDAYEAIPVSSDMLDWAKKLKEIFKKLFDPLKKAWDGAKKYLENGFKYMKNELGKTFKSIGRDFLTVWNQPKTVAMLENLLRIVGDLEFVVGNLAKKFRQAWDEVVNGKTRGQSIFEGIRDILATIIQHVRNVTKYMKEWSNKLDFKPLLKAIDEFLPKLNKLVDFLGGIFEDVMKEVVLEHIRYLIEEGIPHLLEAIGEIIDAFDFEDLRSKLKPILTAFETLRQNIHEGLVNAMKNVGKAVAEWTKTEQFAKFCETVVYILGQVTPERVEKLFTGLGLGILEIVKALADFISSDDFKQFIDDIVAWYDSLSAEDIANFIVGIANGIKKIAEALVEFVTGDMFQSFVKLLVDWFTNSDPEKMAKDIEKLAIAIGLFKFGSFVGTGLAGCLKFFASLKTLTTLGKVAKGLTDVANGTSVAGKAAEAAGKAAAGGATSTAAAGTSIAGVAALAAAATADFVLVKQDVDRLKEASDTYADAQKTHAKEVKNSMDTLYTLYTEKGPEIAAEWAKTVYDIDVSGDDLFTAQNKVERKIEELWDGTPENMWDGFTQGWDYYFGKDGAGIGKYCEDAFTGLIGGIKGVLGIASPSTVFDEMGQNTVKGYQQGFDSSWAELLTDGLGKAGEFVTEIGNKLLELGTKAGENLGTFKDNVTTNVSEAAQKAKDKGKEILDNVVTQVEKIPKDTKDDLKEFLNNTKDTYKEVKKATGDKLNETRDVVVEKLGRIKDKFQKFDLSRMATNIIRGFLSGLRSAWTDVMKWASDSIANLKKKFSEGLKIHSPSKVFMEYGEYVVEGFNKGINDFAKTTDKTIDKWVSGITDTDVQLTPNMSVISSSMVSDISGTDIVTKSDMRSLLSEFADKIIESSKAAQSQETKVVLELDGRTVYEQVVKQDRQQLLRTGKGSFAY